MLIDGFSVLRRYLRSSRNRCHVRAAFSLINPPLILVFRGCFWGEKQGSKRGVFLHLILKGLLADVKVGSRPESAGLVA